MNLGQRKTLSQLIANCWSDEGLKQRLLADPEATLKKEGVEIPAGLSVKALENTEKLYHLVIPLGPTELADEDLNKIARIDDYCRDIAAQSNRVSTTEGGEVHTRISQEVDEYFRRIMDLMDMKGDWG